MRKSWRKKADNLLLPSFIIFSVVIIDQISKIEAVEKSSQVICNQGYAFGLFQGYLNIFVVVLVLLVAFYNFSRAKRFNFWIGWAFILGGGLGNMVDRLSRGCVVDFIQTVSFWPSFNIADAAISLGVGILVFSLLKGSNA